MKRDREKEKERERDCPSRSYIGAISKRKKLKWSLREKVEGG